MHREQAGAVRSDGDTADETLRHRFADDWALRRGTVIGRPSTRSVPRRQPSLAPEQLVDGVVARAGHEQPSAVGVPCHPEPCMIQNQRLAHALVLQIDDADASAAR